MFKTSIIHFVHLNILLFWDSAWCSVKIIYRHVSARKSYLNFLSYCRRSHLSLEWCLDFNFVNQQKTQFCPKCSYAHMTIWSSHIIHGWRWNGNGENLEKSSQIASKLFIYVCDVKQYWRNTYIWRSAYGFYHLFHTCLC